MPTHGGARGDRQASRVAQRAPKVGLTTCKPSVRNLDDSCSSFERGTAFRLEKETGRFQSARPMFALSCLGGGQCAGHGATTHKKLAWLACSKRSPHFDNTTAAFGQKRIDPEMDTFSGPCQVRRGTPVPIRAGILLQKKPGRVFYPARRFLTFKSQDPL